MTCEKCWADAYARMRADTSKTQTEHYNELIRDRQASPCTAREQAGQYWDEKLQRDTRETEEDKS